MNTPAEQLRHVLSELRADAAQRQQLKSIRCGAHTSAGALAPFVEKIGIYDNGDLPLDPLLLSLMQEVESAVRELDRYVTERGPVLDREVIVSPLGRRNLGASQPTPMGMLPLLQQPRR